MKHFFGDLFVYDDACVYSCCKRLFSEATAASTVMLCATPPPPQWPTHPRIPKFGIYNLIQCYISGGMLSSFADPICYLNISNK